MVALLVCIRLLAKYIQVEHRLQGESKPYTEDKGNGGSAFRFSFSVSPGPRKHKNYYQL